MRFLRSKSIYAIFIATVIFGACEKDAPEQIDPLRYKSVVFDSVKTTRDIYYRTASTFEGVQEDLFLDFSEPYGDSIKNRPLVILMHAGGFIQGHRGWMATLSEMLPLYGYACANISYRLYDGKDFPLDNEDFLESFILARKDLISAIDYFINHASGEDPYRIDVDNIFVAGASAGAIAALHTVPLNKIGTKNERFLEITKKIQNRLDPDWQKGPELPVRGIISFAGAIIDSSWITLDYPDVFCVHGTADKIVPYSHGMIQIANVILPLEAFGSEIICEKTKELGINTVLIADEGFGHESFFTKTELWQDPAIQFLYSSMHKDNQP